MFTNLTRDQVARHVTVVGWLVLVSGLFGVLGAGCFWVTISTIAATVVDADAVVILPALATGAAGFIALLSLVSIAAGYGMIRRASWGRILGLVDAFLGLLSFPLGTILGVYAIWVLFQAEAIPLFESGAEAPE